MRRVTHMNDSCCAYEHVYWRVWRSHVTHHGMSHMYCMAYFTSHIWMSHVTPINESRHTCEWVASHTRMSHVTHQGMSHIYCVAYLTSHICMSHITHHGMSHMYVTSHIWMRHEDTCWHASRCDVASCCAMRAVSKPLHSFAASSACCSVWISFQFKCTHIHRYTYT